jgi:K+-transporting ATPase KdpF subunit
MPVIETLALVVAVAVLAYLTWALLKPEAV